MCGIAGILSNTLAIVDVTQRAQNMQNALAHRGPDDQGLFTSATSATAFAHTRLSIIDLSQDGHQPMSSECGRYTITYNGEIYNYRQLRDQLIVDGANLYSHSDTEVILHLYQKEGESCLAKLRGMFAFCIWDELQQTAFLARDPLGIKPLYYWRDENTLAFASELRALLDSKLSSSELSSKGLQSYFLRGSVSEPNTVLKETKILGAGHSIIWKDGHCKINQHAKLKFRTKQITHTKAISLTRAALEDSVKAHFVGDVPVGIFLSGGIDSTALLAIATQISDQPIRTYSIGFESPEWNEADAAQRIAQHFGSEHTELIMTEEIARGLFDGFLQAIDQPTIDGFNTYCVAKLAHDNGAKVVLSGVGGDELFAGYASFQTLPKMLRIHHNTRWLRPLFKLASHYLDRLLSSRLRRLIDYLSAPISLNKAHQSLRGIFSRSETRALLKNHDLTFSKTEETPNNQEQPLEDQISQLELSQYMRNQLLRDSDVMSMAWGLELRLPFVDYKLMRSLTTIPADIRLRFGKKLLVESVPEIPSWVTERPKQGFRFPFEQWFGDHWSELETRPPVWVSLKPWYRRWNLVVLEYWLTHYQQKT